MDNSSRIVTHLNEKHRFDISAFHGRGDDKSFELLPEGMVEWFIDNLAPTWRRELTIARQTVHQQRYVY